MMFLASRNPNEMPLTLVCSSDCHDYNKRTLLREAYLSSEKKKAVTSFFVACWWFFLSWRNTSHCENLCSFERWQLRLRVKEKVRTLSKRWLMRDVWGSPWQDMAALRYQIAAEYKHKVTLWIQTRRIWQRRFAWKLCDSRAPCRAGHMNSGTKLPCSTSQLLPAFGYRSFSFCVCSPRPKIVQRGLQRPSIRQSGKKKPKTRGFAEEQYQKAEAPHMDTAENDTNKQSRNITSMSIHVK